MAERRETIQARLRSALTPTVLEVRDESRDHAGHAGAAGGGSHFSCTIVSETFRGKSLVERHRSVYAAVSDMLEHEIHALAIETFDPDEWARRDAD